MPISEYPEVAPPSVVVRAQYPGANPKVIAETVATPIEEQINGVEGMLYMSSQATTDGLMTLTVTFRLGTDPDKAQQLVQNRVSQAEPRLPEEVRRLGITTVKSSPDLTHGRASALAERPLRHDLSAQLRACSTSRTGSRASTASARCSCSARGDYSMRVWLDPQKVAERGLSASDVVREIRAQNVQAAAGVIGASPSAAGHRPAALDQRAGPAAERGGVRRHRRQDRRRTARSRGCATSRASSSAPPNTRCARCSTTSRRSAIGIFQAPGSNALADLRQRPRDDGRAQAEHAGRRRLRASSTTRRSSCAPRSRPWSTRCSKRSRWSCSSW